MSHNKTKKGKSLMKRYTILLLILMSAYSVAFAQTIFTGKITDGKGTPLSDITVMALSEKTRQASLHTRLRKATDAINCSLTATRVK